MLVPVSATASLFKVDAAVELCARGGFELVKIASNSSEVLKAVHLWKSNPVHEVDDGAEDIVGALLHIDGVLPLPHPCVQCSLEVLGPESNYDS